MNTNDTELLRLFETLTTEQKIDIARHLLQNKDIKSTTVIATEEDKAISFAQPYVFAFTSNFRVFSDLDISKNEFRVLTYILEYMEFGNLINLSQSSLCKALNIASGNMSNIFKKLKQKGILVEHHGHLYINSNIFAKGMSHQLDEKRKEHLSNAKASMLILNNIQSIMQIFHRKKDETYLWKLKIKRSTQMPLFLARRRKIMLFLMLKTVSRSINLARYIKEQKKMRRQEKT
jgi:glycosyltransferase involved in cell wall biosynthesis